MSKIIFISGRLFLVLVFCITSFCSKPARSVFSKDNITPWCIVPFDAKQRNPRERAEMLYRLGFKTMAYDWRDVHIPEFDEEVKQLKEYGISMTAFWWSGDLPVIEDDFKTSERIKLQIDFIKRNSLKLDVWIALTEPGEQYHSDEVKYAEIARRIDILAGELNKAGCRLAIYNHGGWCGQPDNMVAIVKKVKAGNVGIVYNFHHGHEHLEMMPSAFHKMLPWLYCVNLNGMNEEGPKILPLGEGREDAKILKMIAGSGYNGPIGIIGHTANQDVEIVLQRNLEGLKKLLIEIKDHDALKTF